MKMRRFDSLSELQTTIGTYPDCYLAVEECRSGTYWIAPLRGNALLDLKHQVKRWIKSEFGGAFRLNGNLMPRLQGDYFAQIVTDGRPIDSTVVWQSGGFYLVNNP